ncbi:30S ribosomal protein S2 [Candidatus Kaiserbacteria bacterium]|nr:30S ribosomal protein S2 [Candidatus Kaiserbacteria bacterium]NCT02216.1 30S ribosomal protein S2 [Candidatus Parcubacteria bacterium]
MSTTSNNPTFIDRLFKSGSHFGFKKSRRHPTVTSYLYGTKDGNDIFDLEKVATSLDAAKAILSDAGTQGKSVLFVSTKDESAVIVKAAAEKIAAPYVTNRWIGGMLSNFSEIKKRINRLEALVNERESGELERKYTKKERVVISREVDKLTFNFFGISKMVKLPDLMVVVDPRHDAIAVTEAQGKHIPVIAIMSSDCDTNKVQYPVVANDSLQSSVSLLIDELVAAYAAGKTAYVPKPVEARRAPTRRRAE